LDRIFNSNRTVIYDLAISMARHKDKFRGQVLKDGRITIPKVVRDELEIKEGMFFEAKVIDQDTIQIKFFRV